MTLRSLLADALWQGLVRCQNAHACFYQLTEDAHALLSAVLQLSVDDLIRYANGNFVLIYLLSMAAGWSLLHGIWRLLAGLSAVLCSAVLVMLGSDALYAVALFAALLLLSHLRDRHKALAQGG